MKISVTQEHIDKADVGSRSSCALALALQDAGFPKAIVGFASFWPKIMSNERILLPEEAVQFREMFDQGLKPAPIEFEIEVPA